MAKSTRAAATAENDEVYSMEDILEFKSEGGKGLWKVRWEGYGPADDTWEPQANLLNPGSKLKSKMEETKAAFLSDKDKKEKVNSSVTTAGRGSKRRARKSNDTDEPEDKQEQSSRESVKSARQNGPKLDTSSTPVVARGVCRVAHISRSDVDKKSYVCTIIWNNGDSEIRPVQEVRKEFPEHLLDYLLSRIKFKDPRQNGDEE